MTCDEVITILLSIAWDILKNIGEDMSQSFNHVWSGITAIEKWCDVNVSQDALIAIPALFVALLIPITFFLMERNDLYGFDKNVILDKVILYKVSVPLTLLASMALLFKLSIVSLVLSAILFGVIFMVIVRTYRWMTAYELVKYKITYKQKRRLMFLRSIKGEEEKIDTWALILNDNDLLEKNQRGLTDEFIRAVKSTKEGKNSHGKSNLFALMNRNIQKIDFSDIQSYEELVTFSIEYFKLWRDARKKREEEPENKDAIPYPPHSQKELALSLLRLGLDKKISDIFGYCYFNEVKKYLAKADVNEADFIRDFLPSYIELLKENDNFEIRTLWEELSDWNATEESLSNEESWPKSRALLNSYMSSIGQRARADMDLPDREVDIINEVTELVLPLINTSFWFNIITLYNTGWGLDEGEDSLHGQIRSHVSRSRNFGLFNSYGVRDWVDDEEARMEAWREESDRQDDETIFILGLVYPWLRNPKEIQKVLDQIGIIETEGLFEEGSSEADKLETLKSQFERIRDYTEKKIAEKEAKK